MRTTQKIIAYLLFVLSDLSSQNLLFDKFNKSIDLYDSVQDNGLQVIEVKGKLFNLGTVYNSTLNAFGIVTSVLDTNGALLNKRKFLYPAYNSFYMQKVLEHKNSVYGIGYANKFADTLRGYDFMFAKFNANGDTIFTKIFSDTGSVAPYDAVPYDDHSFLVMCEYAKDYNSAEYSKNHLLIIDTLGNIIKSSFEGLALYEPSFLIHNKIKHEIYTLGIYKSQPGNSFVMHSYLRCFNDTSLALKFTVNNISGGNNDFIQSAVLYNNSIYATFASEIWSPPVPFAGNILKLYKYQFLGQSLNYSSKMFMPHDTSGYASTVNIMVDKDKVIFGGFNSYTGLNFYVCDTNLTSICLQKINAPDTLTNFSLANNCLLNSGRIASTGMAYPVYYTPGTSIAHWYALSAPYTDFIKYNCGDFVGLPENKRILYSLEIYPNPAIDQITLHLENNAQNDYDLEFTNALGEHALFSTLVNGDATIDVSGLRAGVYFCRLISNNNVVHTRKFIKN